MIWFYYSLLAVVSYLIGNLSSARVVAFFHKGDITKSGSGNPGTLNVWRTYGFWPGIITFVMDMLKSLIPCVIAYFTFDKLGCNVEIALYIAGFAAVLGHIFPIVYKFKGGKGIATSIGVFLVANPLVTLIVFICMIVLMLFIKYASIMTIGAVLVMSIIEIVWCNPVNFVNYICIAGILALVFYAHRKNIIRIFKRQENKTELLAMVKKIFKKKTATQTQAQTNIQTQSESLNLKNNINTKDSNTK